MKEDKGLKYIVKGRIGWSHKLVPTFNILLLSDVDILSIFKYTNLQHVIRIIIHYIATENLSRKLFTFFEIFE